MQIIRVDGVPQGKARAKTVRLKNGRIMSFTPDKTTLYENFIRLCYGQQSDKRYDANICLRMTIIAYYPIHDSWTKKKKEAAVNNTIRPTSKPDIDNVCKVFLDALNYTAYADDKQVVEIIAKKFYATNPRVEFYLEELLTNE